MTRLRSYQSDPPVRPPGVDQGAVVTILRVPPEAAGQRVDVFVQSQLRRTSRTRTQAIVLVSGFDASGAPLRLGNRVFAEQHLFLWRAPWDERTVPREVPIVYEDEHLFAVNKPALLPVHPTARYHNNTLIKLLQAERPGVFLSLGHRLDRETSGVLLVSKTPSCDRALKRAFERRVGIEKTYVALTWGTPCDPEQTLEPWFRVERGLELDAASPYRVEMRISDSPDALYAATRFMVEAVAGPYARVRCALETGRQHQIRVHLASLGTPIVGDKLYGPDPSAFMRGADGTLTDDDLTRLELPRHALHAWRLALPHPISGKALEIEAPLPEDLEAFWRSRL
ncbi:MAG: RluA family pseudouridine synthase [Myxococcales bacterium]